MSSWAKNVGSFAKQASRAVASFENLAPAVISMLIAMKFGDFLLLDFKHWQ